MFSPMGRSCMLGHFIKPKTEAGGKGKGKAKGSGTGSTFSWHVSISDVSCIPFCAEVCSLKQAKIAIALQPAFEPDEFDLLLFDVLVS